MSDPSIARDLVDFVCRMGFVAQLDVDGAILVDHPGGVPAEAARMELDLYLSLWRATNDEYSVSLVIDAAA